MKDTKICCHCKQKLGLDKFYKNKWQVNGYGKQCKVCKRSLRNKLYSKNKVVQKDTSHLVHILLEDRHYMAGLFDGEGCILIARIQNKSVYQLCISLGSKDRCITDWVHEHFGGRVCFTKRKAHIWSASSLEAGEILKTFVDFLVLKRARAQLALEFLEKTSKRITLNTWDEQLKIREYYLQEIRKHNRREV